MRLFNKNTIAIAIAVMTIFLGGNVVAADNLPASEVRLIFKPLEQSSKAIVSVPGGTNARITIRKANGDYLFSKQVNAQEGYAEIYNFKGLDSGIYEMRLLAGNYEERQTFSIDNDGNLKNIELLRGEFMPSVVHYGSTLEVKMMNIFNEPVSVQLIKGNEVVFEDYSVKSLACKYQLQKLPAGTYKLKIAAGTKSYTKSIKL